MKPIIKEFPDQETAGIGKYLNIPFTTEYCAVRDGKIIRNSRSWAKIGAEFAHEKDIEYWEVHRYPALDDWNFLNSLITRIEGCEAISQSTYNIGQETIYNIRAEKDSYDCKGVGEDRTKACANAIRAYVRYRMTGVKEVGNV